MTLEEYEKVLEERRKSLQALKIEERKVDLDKDFESMQQLSGKKGNDEIFIKLVMLLMLHVSSVLKYAEGKFCQSSHQCFRCFMISFFFHSCHYWRIFILTGFLFYFFIFLLFLFRALIRISVKMLLIRKKKLKR